jgi:hypothetical protein
MGREKPKYPDLNEKPRSERIPGDSGKVGWRSVCSRDSSREMATSRLAPIRQVVEVKRKETFFHQPNMYINTLRHIHQSGNALL